jgi:catechol 2,3-dioxygenase
MSSQDRHSSPDRPSDRAGRPGQAKAQDKAQDKVQPRPIAENPAPSADRPAADRTIDPGVRIGHIHLKVADLERSLRFYRDILGFTVTRRREGAVFMSAGGYHHHIAINTWESAGGRPPPPGSTGLYHTAILYPSRRLLADALRRLIAAGIPLDGAADHGVSEALYLRDPDMNGVELYCDRPREEWQYAPNGDIVMPSKPLDLRDLLSELDKPAA